MRSLGFQLNHNSLPGLRMVGSIFIISSSNNSACSIQKTSNPSIDKKLSIFLVTPGKNICDPVLDMIDRIILNLKLLVKIQ